MVASGIQGRIAYSPIDCPNEFALRNYLDPIHGNDPQAKDKKEVTSPVSNAVTCVWAHCANWLVATDKPAAGSGTAIDLAYLEGTEELNKIVAQFGAG